MRLAGERILRGASFAALHVAADVDRVLMCQRVELLILIAAAKRRAAEMAIDLDSPAPLVSPASYRRAGRRA